MLTSVLVVSSKRRDTKALRAYLQKSGVALEGDGRIRVETIKRGIPVEVDNAFVANAEFLPADHTHTSAKWAKLNAAVSRGRRRVEVYSAQPRESLTAHACFPETAEHANVTTTSQRPQIRPFRRLAHVRTKTNLSRKKFERSTIDSIALEVSAKDAPFSSRFPEGHESIPEKLPMAAKGFRCQWAGLNISVIENRRHHTFRFFELSLLHRNGLTNLQFVRYVTKYVLQYLDYRIELSAIAGNRIDLAFFITDGLDRGAESFKRCLGQADLSRAKSLYGNGKARTVPSKEEL